MNFIHIIYVCVCLCMNMVFSCTVQYMAKGVPRICLMHVAMNIQG
jgi:hypothetical protein